MLGAAVSALVATWVVLSGVRGSGHRLVRDFVAVPIPAAPESLLPSTASSLRAWPLDALTWAASFVIPTAVQQVVLLASCLLLAGVGTGLVVRRAGTAAAVAAAWVAIWNPYVAERLLLGQVPTLLGYACLPWIVVVGRSRLSSGRRLALLFLVAAPAAVTPWGGVMALVAAVLVELSRADRTPRRVLLVTGVGVLWCSPWLLPAVLTGGVAADPDGPAAFALADDSGLGTWVSALMGGGVWATGAQPLSRSDPVAIASSLALLVLALGGVAVLTTRSAPGTVGTRRRTRIRVTATVAVLALLGPATLAWWGSGPGLEVLVTLQQVPGVALVRDQHRMLAPAVLTVAVLVGLAVGWLARHGGTAASALACVLVVALGVASVPDLRPVRAHGLPPRGVPAGVGCRDRCRGRGRDADRALAPVAAPPAADLGGRPRVPRPAAAGRARHDAGQHRAVGRPWWQRWSSSTTRRSTRCGPPGRCRPTAFAGTV